RALLLNPQGRILAELEIYALKDRLLTPSHASLRQRTVETLDKYIIMDDVTLEDLTDKLGSLAIEGPQAARTIEKAYGFDLDEMPDLAIRSVHIDSMPCEIIRRSHFGHVGMEVVAPQKSLKQIWENLLKVVRSRGKSNRRRARLKFSTPEPPPPGTRLSIDGKELGLVTSSAFSPKENTAIGMGYSRREHDTPGSVLDSDDGSTTEVVA